MAISQIVQNSLANTISLGPKITSVQVANSSYTVLDDTAVNVGGGYIVITGSGFQSNCSVIVDANLACSVAFVSATQVRAQLPAKPAGTYNIYLLNGDGGTAIRVNALQYSNTPTWVTTSPLTNQQEDSNVSIQLSATGANTYVLQTGSTLPTGLTLSANGLISGTVNTNVTVNTTYNFTVEAIDTENQETPKAFEVTIIVADTNFYRTVLLLDGDGTNNANNNVFRDSSNNNYTVSRTGNVTQGSFSPFSPSDWSVYFSAATSSYIDCGDQNSFTLPNGNYTVEAWVWPQEFQDTGTSNPSTIIGKWGTPSQQEWLLFAGQDSNGTLRWYHNSSSLSGSSDFVTTTGTLTKNAWNHVAVVRESNAVNIYINGVKDTGQSYTGSVNTASVGGGTTQVTIGAIEPTYPGYDYTGYISNVRISNNARYTGASFTVPTAILSSDANTILLTCQSNRGKDNSSNDFTLTPKNSAKITNFSPFKPTALYSTTTYGGSAYFDGTTDYLSVAQTLWSQNGNATFEAWIYVTDNTVQRAIFDTNGVGDFCTNTNNSLRVHPTGSNWFDTPANSLQINAWNHVALVQTATTREVFINGKKQTQIVGNGSPNTVGWDTFNGQVNIGKAGLRNNFIGNITDVRIANSALYTVDFTIPSAPLSLTSGTNLLINSTNSSIYDWTTKNVIETVGTASVNTSVKKYGTGSLFFDGNSDWLELPNSPNYLFGTGDFTVECWFYPNAVTGTPGANQAIVGMWGGKTSSASWLLYLNAGNLYWYTSTNGSTQTATMNAASGMSAGNWYHLALVRNAGRTDIYVNGVSIVNTSSSVNLFNATCSLTVGYNPIGGTPDYVYGNIDDLRISKFARYTGNFTVPTTAFPRQ